MGIGTSKNKAMSFFDIYINEIVPKIKEIDIFLKSSSYSLDLEEISKVLYIPAEEILKIMKSKNISEITKSNFFSIMLSGSSYICNLFRREIKCGNPTLYTASDISYIYNIDKKVVENAFNFLDIEFVSENMLPAIFTQVRLKQ